MPDSAAPVFEPKVSTPPLHNRNSPSHHTFKVLLLLQSLRLSARPHYVKHASRLEEVGPMLRALQLEASSTQLVGVLSSSKDIWDHCMSDLSSYNFRALNFLFSSLHPLSVTHLYHSFRGPPSYYSLARDNTLV